MINTLDLDEISKEDLGRILTKIYKNECCDGIKFKDSDSKGYHVWIYCNKEDCFMCRMVFDHDKRFLIDSFQPIYMQNTFFDRKEHFIWRDYFGKERTIS